MSERKIEKIVTRSSLKRESSDASYWLSRPPVERLAALEEIRQEYNRWKYPNAGDTVERVYRVVRLKRS